MWMCKYLCAFLQVTEYELWRANFLKFCMREKRFFKGKLLRSDAVFKRVQQTIFSVLFLKGSLSSGVLSIYLNLMKSFCLIILFLLFIVLSRTPILDRFLIFIFLIFIVFSCKVGGFAMCFRTQVRHDLQCTISGESPCLPLSQLYNYKEV